MNMQQINMRETGDPSVLFIEHARIPQPKADELLVRVAFAGVNRPDIMQRQGLYPMPKDVTPIMGLELSGEVVALGKEVKNFNIGDLVCALTDGGAYAEYCVVKVGQVLLLPKGYTLQEAAMLPETFFTVWANLFMQQQMKPGESLLVHGGTSGIGITALAIAKSLGIITFATVGNAEKCEVVAQLGAIAINYKTENFVERIRQYQTGVDGVLDLVGASYFAQNLDILNKDGWIFLIGFMGGHIAEQIDLLNIAVKRATLTGSTMRGRTAEEKAVIAQSLLENVWDKLAKGEITKPILHKCYDFREVTQAHREMDKGTHIGKILLAF
ncbi:NAD(P)H-quinone oxidoreductase [Rodentibacter caecimuris]|uniref:NAD(P)H-quinone oxidoreductase n=1 Tax=Rodentibacter caecimuris TaxID=1796644 RepID=UPI00224980D0|nr:NAD(P)H-quinone oxidoreductase [Rodentibacter heylii]MCX2961224.1 NAD(P)H-quinone oxidoreductase [Rodentibacter heylii]